MGTGTDQGDLGTTKIENGSDPISLLASEYAERMGRNPNYSLRAFARSLKVPPGPLSEILSRKRTLTPQMGAGIARHLPWTPEKTQRFLISTHRHESNPPTAALKRLESDQFHLVADWYHYAILSLAETNDFDPSPKAIAQRLNISVVQARLALERLTRLNLIKPINGSYELLQGGVCSTEDIPDAALRDSHRQILEMAITALEETPLERRDVTSITLAIDVDRIALAKRRIKRFRRSLGKFLEAGKKSRVYHLNIQLVPVGREGRS